MHIENLSHWSGNLNVIASTVMDTLGFSCCFASSGVSHNEYYDFSMINACASL